MKKRILSIFLMFCLLGGMLTATSGFVPQVEAKTTIQYGLTVDKNGSFQLNGKTFYGYGINVTAGNIWQDPFDTSFEDSLKVCQKYDIPFVRVPLTYGTVEEYEAFANGDDHMFDAAKRMLDLAQEAGIGVIVFMLNSQRYTSMLGEKASSQGDLNSKSMAFMKKWIAHFVELFKDHPALWGWEIRNEGNLEADLYDTNSVSALHNSVYGETVGEVSAFDCKPAETFRVLYQEVAKTIRQQDSYRMISNGNAIMRTSAYHLHQASQKRNDKNEWTVDWTVDTFEQFEYINEYLTPDPVNVMSLHEGMPPLNQAAYRYELADKALSYQELLEAYVNLAKKNKKGFYFGEFGSMGYLPDLSAEEVKTRTVQNLSTMVNAGVQLATMWQFNGNNAYISDEGHLSSILAEIQKTNQKFKNLGFQKTDEYWAAVAKQEANNTTTSKPTSSNSTTTKPVTGTTTATNAVDLSSFMLSSSTKLTISASDNTITIEKPITFDVLKRSIKLKSGYTMTVLDTTGNTITADDTVVNEGCAVSVFDPSGEKQVTLSVKTTATESTETQQTDPSSAVNGGEENENGWLLWVIVAAAIVVLAAGGFVLYWFCLRHRIN